MKKLCLAILMLFLVSTVSAASIGVAPGFQNFGEIQKGERRVANLYITTSGYDNPFPVAPEMGDPLTSTFMNSEGPVPPSQYSGESIDSWITFAQDTYTVTPGNTTSYTLQNGVPVNAAGKAKFYVDVPLNAEPGYHAGMINVNPQLGNSGTGFGATARGQSMYTFVFRVPGNVVKDISVVDVRGIRTGENEARIDMRIANRGTVTTVIRGADVGVYRLGGQKVGEVDMGYYNLKPGETTVVSTSINSGSISQGSYRINGTISYIGGSSFLGQQTFSLAGTITQNPGDPQEFAQPETPQKQGGPLWLLTLFVALVAVVMYAFEFDFFSITLVSGGLGVAGFILMTGIPNWTLLILLTSTAVILMYG